MPTVRYRTMTRSGEYGTDIIAANDSEAIINALAEGYDVLEVTRIADEPTLIIADEPEPNADDYATERAEQSTEPRDADDYAGSDEPAAPELPEGVEREPGPNYNR